MKKLHIGKKILAFTLAAAMACSVNAGIYAEDATAELPARIAATDGTLQIPNTTSSFSKLNASFLSVTGFASEGVHDRTEYLNTSSHVQVKTGKEFVEAIYNAQLGNVKIIELLCDINLGYGKAITGSDADAVFSRDEMANSSYQVTNPLITEAGGIGKVKISNTTGLTIFSQYGATINHGTIQIDSSSSDIVMRNIAMDGVWQWDNSGSHKESGITFLKVNGKDIWIDHCSFTMAQDGLIDLEQGASGVTISWCKIGVDAEEALENESIVASIKHMEDLYQADKAAIAAGTQTDFTNSNVNINAGKETLTIGRYPKLREAGATPEEIMKYAAHHSKVHLCGSGDKDIDVNPNLEISLAYSWYINTAQRVPMIRQGTGHVYNCYMDDMSHSIIETKFRNEYNVNGGYGMTRCMNARNGASIAADTCVYYGINGATIGAELQGDDTANMNEPWDKNFANTYNHSLIVNSKITKTDGSTYTGSSWDNNGENLFTDDFTWHDKSTIGKWTWKTITTVPAGAVAGTYQGAFSSVCDYEATLPYSYQLVPLDDVESVVKTNAGMGTYDMTQEQWCRTTYEATEEIAAAGENKINIASSVKFADEEPVIYVGDKVKLEVITDPVNVTDATYTWSVSNMTKKYATVDSATGELTAVSKGTAKLTCKVTSLNGTVVSATVSVKVEPAEVKPTDAPTPEPTVAPTPEPTLAPTPEPTDVPTPEPTDVPTPEPTDVPTPEPTDVPTPEPTDVPTPEPTDVPTPEPTDVPTPEPTPGITEAPTPEPTETAVPPTETPDVSGGSVLAGDANLDKDVTLDDANIVLKAALGIGDALTGDALIAADVDGVTGVTLDDANIVLKLALGIPVDLPKKEGEAVVAALLLKKKLGL